MTLCKKVQQNISLLREELIKTKDNKTPISSFPIFLKLYFFIFLRAILRVYAFLFAENNNSFFILTGTKRRQRYFTVSSYCVYKRVQKQTIGFGRAAMAVILIASVIGSSSLYLLMDILRPGKSTFPTEAAGEAWYSTGASWSFRKQITIDHTKVADVATPSTTYANFPVLISLDSLSNINADGTDIRFTSSDGVTELPREIEKYSSGSLRAWVKTTLTKDSSDSTDDIIYMYYGNAGASEPAASSTYGSQNVWKTDGVDTSTAMVQHLKEDPSGSAPQMIDSTANANNGTSGGTMTTSDQVAGQIDGSLDFDGTNDYVDAGNGASLDITNAITVEAWANIPAPTYADKSLISKENSFALEADHTLYSGSQGTTFFIYSGGSWYKTPTLSVQPTAGWHHIVGVFNGTNLKLYIDGTEGAITVPGVSNIASSASNVQIGRYQTTQYFSGTIDETRIYNRALTAEEITTQYNNTNSPATFYSLGVEEKQSPTALTSWGYRKAITIDHAKVASNQTNFPVLINLTTDASLASHALSTGNDILFTSSSTTWGAGTENDKLAHEIEKYTTATGELQAWVRVPSLSSTTDTVIYMYYGNATATNQQNKTVVWDGSAKMVQHLAEAPANDVAGHLDSTQYANNGTPKNFDGTPTSTTDGTGQIDGADTFDGVNDYVDAGNGASLNITNAITISAWVNLNNISNYPYIYSRTTQYLFYVHASGYFRFDYYYNGTSIETLASLAGTATTGNWIYVVGVLSPTRKIIYLNGVENNNQARSQSTVNSVSSNAYIGSRYGSQFFMNGSIDETRIYNRALTAEEITTQYNNTNSPATFYSLGVEEKQSPTALTSWGYRKAITIDHAKVASNQTNFPVLINLTTDASLASHALSTGNDILFISSSTTWGAGTENDKLAHEIEKYTTATGELQAWVRVPSLSSTVDTVIYLYYGNAASASQQNKTAVWDGSAKMVQHMKEDPSGSAPQMIDSTANANNGTSGGTMTTGDQVAGQINGSLEFDGTDDYVDAGSGVSLNLQAMSVESWFYSNELSNAHHIFSKSYSANRSSFYFGTRTNNILIWSVLDQDGTTLKGFNSGAGTKQTTAGLLANTWYHMVGTYDGNIMLIYLNGALLDSKDITDNTIPYSSNTSYVGVNYYLSGGGLSSFFSGTLDETRIYSRALTAEEITTQYNNESAPSSFYALGSEEYFDYLSITGNASMNAGASQVITITDKLYGTANTGYTGDKSLTFSGANISDAGNNPTCSDKTGADINFGAATTVTFTSGIATCTLKLYKVESAAIHITDGTIDSTNYDLSVNVGTILSGTGIQINTNDAYTITKDTTLTLAATGASWMRFSNDNITYSAYEAYATTKAWDITDALYGGTAPDGAKTVYAKYKDSFGNEASVVNDNIVYDTAPPTNPSSAIDSQGAVTDTWQNNKNDPNFTSFTGESDANGIAEYYVYFGVDSAGTTADSILTDAYDPASFADSGTRYLRVIVKDNAGLWADPDGAGATCANTNADRPADADCWSAIFIHKYDHDSPNTPSPVSSPLSWTKTNSFDFSWTNPGDIGGSGVENYTYQTNAGTASTDTVSTSVTGLTSDFDGLKLFSVKANDNAGNSGAEGSSNFYYDSTVPTNAGAATDGNGSLDNIYGIISDPNFTWVAGSDASSDVKDYDVYWGTDSNGETITATVAANAYDPSAIPVNTPYYLRIRTRDNALNTSAWETKFTMKYSQAASSPSNLSQTADSAPLAFGAWTADTAPAFNFTLTDPDTDTLGYIIKIDNNSDFSSPEVFYTYSNNDLVSGVEASFTVGQSAGTGSYTNGEENQILADGQYFWKVRAVENHGLTSAEVLASAEFALGIDTLPPADTALSLGVAAANTIAVSVSGAVDAGSGLNDAPYYFTNTTAGTNSGWIADAAWTSSSLTPNTSYSFQVKTRDALNNESAFTVAQSKATLSSAPSALALAADSASQITASWSANSNPDGTLYYVENITAGTNSGWITGLSWASTGLTLNTQYSFRVQSKDALGNESAFTPIQTKHTLANIPASLSLISDSPSQITAAWSVNSNPVGTQYYAENTPSTGSGQVTNSGWINAASWTSTNLTCGAGYSFQVKARNNDNTETAFSDSVSLAVQPCGAGGGLPAEAYNSPAALPSSSANPEAGFRISINQNASRTNSSSVILSLTAGADTKRMSISESSDFANISSEPFQSTKNYTLSSGDGVKTVYARFYTQYGASSETVSDSIILDTSFATPEPSAAAGFATPQPSPETTAGEAQPLAQAGTPTPAPYFETPPDKPAPVNPNWNLLDTPKVEEFSPQVNEISFFTNKFSSLLEAFKNLGISQLSDIASRASGVSFNIPNLRQILGLESPANSANPISPFSPMLLADLSADLKKQIPSEIAFVSTASEKIDLDSTLVLDEGFLKQKISAPSSTNLNIALKPDHPARSISGYLALKKSAYTLNYKLQITNDKSTSNDEMTPKDKLTGQANDQNNSIFGCLSIKNLIEIKNLKLEILSLLGFKSAAAEEIKTTDKPQTTETRFVLAQFQYTDPDKDGIWSADIQTPAVAGEYEIISLVNYQDPSIPSKEIRLITVIDPEGYVFEKQGDQETRIKNVSVSIYWLNPVNNQYELWNAKDFDQKNPQITDTTGKYSFLVPAGSYYLKAEAPGYHSYQSDILAVSEADNVHMNLELKSVFSLARDWKTAAIVGLAIIVFALAYLLAYNFYQDRRRRV